MALFRLLICFGLLQIVGGQSTLEAAQPGPSPLASSKQLIVVTTRGWNNIDGVLQRYERPEGARSWKKLGTPIPIVVGKNGMGWGKGIARNEIAAVIAAPDPIKTEGDGRSPAGIFALGTSFGYATEAQSGWKLPYLSLSPTIECVDDANSKYYNQIVDSASLKADWKSSEHMRSVGEYYRWGIVVDHNIGPAAPGSGSCIFMHVWGVDTHGKPVSTVGCTAMAQPQLEQVLAWLDPASAPLLVQLPRKQYKHLRGNWRLP